MQMLNAPSRERQDWTAQIGPAEEAARFEQSLASQNANRRLEQVRLGVSQGRLKLDQLIQQNPKMDLIETEGGNYTLINPITGETKDTGVALGSLSPVDKAELEVKTATDIAVARQGEVRTTAEQQHGYRTTEETQEQAGRETLVNMRRRHAIELEKLKQTDDIETMSESDRARFITNNAREALARHSEWKDYINITDDGVVTIKPIGTGTALGRFFGGAPELTKAVRDQIVKFIYGTSGGASAPAGPPANPSTGDTFKLQTGETIRWDGNNWREVIQ